jgi:hypothetical protein
VITENGNDLNCRAQRYPVAALVLCLVLGGCGGGGGGGNGAANSAPDSVTVSGRVTFDRVPQDSVSGGLDYESTRSDPVRGATVEAVAENGSILSADVTDDRGDYSLVVPSQTTLTIRVRAEMVRTGRPAWSFRVIDNIEGMLYAIESGSFSSGTQGVVRNMRAASGWDGSAYSEARAAAPFAILDTVYEQLQLVLEVDPDLVFPELELNWSPLNRSSSDFNPELGEIITTAYFSFEQPVAIYVLGDENVDTDEYDEHVVAHEWGHYLEDQLARSDSIGGSHTIFGFLDPRLAMSEGWSNAWSAMALDDSVYKDTSGFGQASAFSFDIESNTTFNPGWYNESSIHSVLYDVFDQSNDGIDTIGLGFGPIYRTLTGAYGNGVPLTTIFSFMTGLKADEPGATDAVNALLEGQNIVGIGMDEWGSTETNDAGTTDVLPVYAVQRDGGAPVTACSISSFGTYNRLSTRRFLRLRISSDGIYEFRVRGPDGSDPDAVLYTFGVGEVFQSEVDGLENFFVELLAGDYVLEVYEFGNLFEPGVGRVCLDTTVEAVG